MLLTSPLVREYLINFARPLIYTTAISNMNVVAADCVFDMLEDGTTEEVCLQCRVSINTPPGLLIHTQLAEKLHSLSAHVLAHLRAVLQHIPSHVLSLPPHLAEPAPLGMPPPAPIIPLMTSYPRPLAAFLATRGIYARPISWPTVPKGADRVRVCLHAGTSCEQVEKLVRVAQEWAHEWVGVERQSQRDGVLGMQAKL